MQVTRSCSLALGAILGCAAWAAAADVVRDTWIDGTATDPAAPTYSENGVDADSDGDLESAWFVGGTGSTLAPVGAGGPLRAVVSTSSASWTTYFTPEASPINLANVGDSMKVTWAFTPTNVNLSNTSQNFRLALVNTSSAGRITSGAPVNDPFTGYALFANMGQTLGNSNPFRLMERANPTTAGAILGTSGDWAALGTTGATSGAPGYASGTEYLFEMTLTHGVGDVMDIVMRMSGGTLNTSGIASVVFSDATPNGGSFTFDTFSIRPSNNTTTADTFDTRLFRVEFTPVPEPTALAALAAAGLVLRRRR